MSAENPPSTIVFVADTEGAEAKINGLKRDIAGLAQTAGTVAPAFDKAGKAVEDSLAKSDRSTKAWANGVKNALLDIQSAGKSLSDKFELKALSRGISPDIYKPLVEQLRTAEVAQANLNATTAASAAASRVAAAAQKARSDEVVRFLEKERAAILSATSATAASTTAVAKAATAGLNNMAMSAKATTNAMRQVPAQFTDIVVSLASGQSAMTVFLQQGGQLKDMFGGIGNAARALGTYLASLLRPLTLTVGAVVALAAAFYKGSQEFSEYNKALIITGNYAGVTASKLSEMAKSVSTATGGTVGAAAEALTELVKTGNVGAANFEQFAASAVRWASATGTSVKDVAAQFAKLGQDPLKASLALNEGTNYLTTSVYQQIKALEEQGRFLEAGVVAQKAWADAINQRAPEIVQNLSYIERAWNAVSKAAKGAIDSVLNIGRPGSTQEQIAKAYEKIADNRANRSYNPMMADADLPRLERELEVLLRMGAAETDRASRQADTAKKLEAQTAVDKLSLEYASKKVKLQLALNDAIGKFANVDLTKAENLKKYTDTINGIQKKFEENEKKAPKGPKIGADQWDTSILKAYSKSMSDLEAIQIKASASAEDLSKTQTALRDIQADPQWAAFSRQQQEQIIYAASLAQAEEDRKATVEASAKALKDYNKLIEDYNKVTAKSIESSADEVRKAEEKYDAHGKLASVLQQEALARLEVARASITMGAGDAAELATIDQLIENKKKLIAVLRKTEILDAADDLAKANKKAAEESSKYWEDALMRAFESGKGFFESLWSTIKNTLKTQVLKVIVSGTMTGVSALASAATGGASNSLFSSASGSFVGNAATSAAGAGSLMSLLGSSGSMGAALDVGGVAITSSTGALTATGYGIVIAAAVAAIAYIANQGETRSGATYVTGPDGKAIKSEGPSGGEIAGDIAKDIFNGYKEGINATLKAVGSTATITGFTAGLESSENGKGFAFAGGMVNGVGVGEYKGRNGGQFSMSDMTPQQAMEAYVTQMNQVTLEALQAATDVPALISKELKNIDIGKLTAAEVGELTKTVQTVIASVNVFNDSLKTLPFESLWNLSFKSAAGLVDAAGGFEKLNESLSGFYENFYSDAEQTSNLTRVLGTGFKALGLSMPTDNLREWYRAQVESAMALDQSIPANQTYLASLLSIQSGVNTLATTAEAAAQRIIDAAKRLEAEIISAQDSAMQEYMSAQAEYASIIAAEQESAAQAMQDAAEAIESAMASAGQGIVQFIQSLLNTPTNAAANYRNDLALAQQGDVEASKRLPTSGRAYLDTQINSSSTAYEAALATAKMVQELNALPAVKTYEQQLLEAVVGTTSAVGGTTDAIKNMNSKITAELSVTARSEILKLINFVANTDLLPDDLKELALSDAGKFSKTISFIQGSSLTAENMKLALMTETELVKTYNFVAGSELTEDQKKQAFGVLTKGDRTINVVAGSLLDADAKKQAFDAVGEVTRTVKIIAESNALAEYKKIALDVTADATKYIQLAATGFSSADAQVITAATAEVTKTVGVALGNSDEYGLAVALAQSGTIEKIMKASGGVLTLDQQMLLNGIEQYNKNIQIGVKIDDGELSEFQQTLMAIFGTMDITGLAAAGVDLSGVISQEALARLQSVNAYVQGFDWVNTDLSTRASQMHAVRTTAIAYGVSSQDVATALGVTRDTLASWYEALNVPFFARGSNFIPENTLAMVHEGERIIPAADNRELMSRLQDPQQNSEALVAEVRALRDDNAAQARAMVQLQQRLTKLMERWDSNGLPTERLET